MKALLHSIKQTFTAAGEQLKTIWHAVRQKATALWRLARYKTAASSSAAQTAVRFFWQKHQSQLAWAAGAAVISAIVTASLIYVGYHRPAVKAWFAALLAGTLRLPAGYILQLIRPVAGPVQAAAAGPVPVSANGPRRRQPATA